MKAPQSFPTRAAAERAAKPLRKRYQSVLVYQDGTKYRVAYGNPYYTKKR